MFRSAGATDVGCQRLVNEDRFHVDNSRGLFIVVDGVGGQAAGGRAADTALDVIRARLSSGLAVSAAGIREAIADANNEVLRQAGSRPAWNGMACVLTVVMIQGDRALIGHVGDTRLYKVRAGRIEKITADHSPVGEREDAGELSELEAMQHPRRNEVYRDVGSELHEPGDAEFVDVRETTWEPDAALLLCSDGLTDLVASDAILGIIQKSAGHPEQVAEQLVKAANDNGGKDNVTVVYVEGEQFARSGPAVRPRSRRLLLHLILWLVIITALAAAWRTAGYPMPAVLEDALAPSSRSLIVVRPGESIGAALAEAVPGTTVMVEPGEYRERLTLKNGVRVLSRNSRGATLRLPSTATDEDVAVRAADVTGAEFTGFRIVGDAASPLGVGVLVRSAVVRLIDLEVTGAARIAVDIGSSAGSRPGLINDVMLLASDIHDNPGAGLTLRRDSSPLISHNEFLGNGSSEQASSALVIEPGARPVLRRNVFRHMDPLSFAGIDNALRTQLRNANVFPDARVIPTGGRGRGSR
jgi:serine/threonine protein phosphatase PrpC